MENFALIFAGGTGSRMNSKALPKQFLELGGQAIIIHTLKHFEACDAIDGICVVCLADWTHYLEDLLEKAFIKKVRWIVPGGETGQDSIFNGLDVIYKGAKNPAETVVLIHDGVRPLISDSLIKENIRCVKEKGTAITVSPAIETILSTDECRKVAQITDRKLCALARAPQSFILRDIYEAHQKAIDEGRHDFIDSASMMKHYGHALFTVDGPPENIKITTSMDFFLFRAFLEVKENSQIYGI